MGHKKNSFKDVSRAEVKKLKELGFIDYDLRKKLGTGQKSYIAKLAGNYKHLLNNPGDFHIQKATKGTKGALKTAGFTVNRAGKAIIPKQGFDEVRLEPGHVHLISKGRSEDIYLAGSRRFFDELKALHAKKGELGRNQMITVQIGDRNPFKQKFRSLFELFKYLEDEFEPKDEGVTREMVFARMSVVTIHDPGAFKKVGGNTKKSRSAYAKKKGGK